MEYEHLGLFLKRCRESFGVTQKYVAEKLSVTPQTISMWEKGKNKIDIDSLMKLCNMYNVDFINALEMLKGERTSTRLPSDEYSSEIIACYSKLNDDGKIKLTHYIQMLIHDPKYIKNITLNLSAENREIKTSVSSSQYKKILEIINSNE